MAHDDGAYAATLTTLQNEIVNFLRTFETIQEDLRLGEVAGSQAQLVAAVGDDVAGEQPPVATTRGLRTLYVALTRPTRRLAIVHAEPLPVALEVPAG